MCPCFRDSLDFICNSIFFSINSSKQKSSHVQNYLSIFNLFVLIYSICLQGVSEHKRSNVKLVFPFPLIYIQLTYSAKRQRKKSVVIKSLPSHLELELISLLSHLGLNSRPPLQFQDPILQNLKSTNLKKLFDMCDADNCRHRFQIVLFMYQNLDWRGYIYDYECGAANRDPFFFFFFSIEVLIFK